MSADPLRPSESDLSSENEPATAVRFQIIGATTLAAVFLYLDRICIAEIAKLEEFRTTLGLSERQVGAVLSAFFLTYALAQVPAGWLSDRLGARTMLPIYISIWSLCTILTGLANGFVMLMVARLLFGISQAGCYPTAGSLIKRWIPLASRGTASAVVSFGGRLGGAIAPLLTAWLLQEFLHWRTVLVLYGVSGFAVAIWFWTVFRETPEEHPRCNSSEQEIIEKGAIERAESGPPP
ncbi:MAG: MFS transporter, partial [Planctomycetaceae bacterium]|nr:MFS transporter [Planctomycetaceae bacterium]